MSSMMDVTAACREISAAAAAAVADLTGYDFAPDAPTPPAIFPEEWDSDFTAEGTPFGDGAFYKITFHLVVSRGDDMTGLRRRNALTKSVFDAIMSGQWTTFSDVQVTGVRAPRDTKDIGGIAYVYAEIDVEVFG